MAHRGNGSTLLALCQQQFSNSEKRGMMIQFSTIKNDLAALIDEIAADNEITEAQALEVIKALDLATAAVDYAGNIRHAAGSFPELQDPLTQASAKRLKYYWGKVGL